MALMEAFKPSSIIMPVYVRAYKGKRRLGKKGKCSKYETLTPPLSFWATASVLSCRGGQNIVLLLLCSLWASFFFFFFLRMRGGERGVKVYTTACITTLTVPHKSGHVMQASLDERETHPCQRFFFFFFFPDFLLSFFHSLWTGEAGEGPFIGKCRNQTVFWQRSTVFLVFEVPAVKYVELQPQYISIAFHVWIVGASLCHQNIVLVLDFSPFFPVELMKSQNPDSQANPHTNYFVLSLNLAFAVKCQLLAGRGASWLWVEPPWGSFFYIEAGRQTGR